MTVVTETKQQPRCVLFLYNNTVCHMLLLIELQISGLDCIRRIFEHRKLVTTRDLFGITLISVTSNNL